MNGLPESDRLWLERIPKVELHLHLEGAIPLPALWELVEKYGGDPEVPDLKALEERFRFRDFHHFMETWVWKNQFIREYEDFTFISEAAAGNLVEQNVKYAEVFYSPGDYIRYGLHPQPMTEAIRRGLSGVPGVEIALIPDLVRDLGPEVGMRIVDQVSEVQDLGLVGIGLGGTEPGFPPEPFKPVFERAREKGFRTTAHAGEAAGPESVWGAIRSLQVDRIGHGTAAFEDHALVDYLAVHALPVELCPISNVRTGVVRSVAEHPVRRFFDRGIPVSVNTDDPSMFNTSLVEEYSALMTEHHYSREEITELVRRAVASSFLSEHRKRALTESMATGWD